MGKAEQAASERYEACAQAMRAAAVAYARAHPFATYRFRWWEFERDMAARAGRVLQPGESCAIVAALPDCYAVADSADARALLEAMEEASGGQGTYMQAKAIVMMQVEAQIERVTKQITAPGDWRCISCAQLLDGYTPLDLEDKGAPGAGAMTVCSGCGALQRVRASADGYEPLPVRDLNRLPKSVRVQLLHLRNNILHRLEMGRARS